MADIVVSSDMAAFLATATDAAARTELGVGTGDVAGPASSLDSALVLFDTTTGKALKGAMGTNPATAATLAMGTITDTVAKPLTISQTWNNAGLTGKLLVLNATLTAGAAASTLQEWQVGGVNRGKFLNTGVLKLLSGSAGAPTYSFEADATYGMYFDTGGTIRFAAAGVESFRIGSASIQAAFPVVYAGSGTAAAPGFSLNGGQGIYKISATEMGIAVGSVQRATVMSTGARIGAIASATPAATTYLNLGESATGTNIAGGHGLIYCGSGTGTGTAATLVFQTPTLAASGSTEQSQATRLTLSATAVTAAVPVVTPSYAVAALPAGVTGMRAMATDANATLAAGVGTTVAAGGANIVPVVYNGSNWVIG